MRKGLPLWASKGALGAATSEWWALGRFASIVSQVNKELQNRLITEFAPFSGSRGGISEPLGAYTPPPPPPPRIFEGAMEGKAKIEKVFLHEKRYTDSNKQNINILQYNSS